MANHEILQEQYNDALFEMLMDDFASNEGKLYKKENERLLQDPSSDIPPETDRRILQLIERETAKRTRSKSAAGFLHFLARMALAALIAVMLFGAAYALSPTFRAGTLNFLMQIDEHVASWQSVSESEKNSEEFFDIQEILVGWLPSGYVITGYHNNGRNSTDYFYENDIGSQIKLSVCAGEDAVYNVDIEDPDYYEEIFINDHAGLLISKNGMIRISWVDSITGNAYFLISTSEAPETLIRIAESISIK